MTAGKWLGVATLDWEADGMLAVYPPDVPAEWHLTWYANRSMAVVLPAERWLAADVTQIEDWVFQVHENFWFYLQCQTQAQVDQALAKRVAFDGRLGGLVLVDGLVMPVNAGVDGLRLGQEVLWYEAADLKTGADCLRDWLASKPGDHALVLVAPALAAQVPQVQTLLELMGELA